MRIKERRTHHITIKEELILTDLTKDGGANIVFKDYGEDIIILSLNKSSFDLLRTKLNVMVKRRSASNEYIKTKRGEKQDGTKKDMER